MKIVTSPLITDISGKVKDIVFASWNGRKYIRSKNAPTGAPSAAQLAARWRYKQLSYFWQQYTTALRNAWNLSAAGAALSGINKFVKINYPVDEAIGMNVSTPSNPDLVPLTSVSGVAGTNPHEIDLTWTGGPVGSQYKIYLVLKRHGQEVIYIPVAGTIPVSDFSYTITGIPWSSWTYLHASVFNADNDQLSLSIRDRIEVFG